MAAANSTAQQASPRSRTWIRTSGRSATAYTRCSRATLAA
jgi:hypothetical protein